ENEGRECTLSFIRKAARQAGRRRSFPRPDGSFFRVLPLLGLGLLTAHQFPVDVGDLLQVLFHLVIVLNPPADLLDLIAWHRATRPMRLVQGHAQIPYWPVALATSTFALGIAAGQVALHQGTTKYFSERRQDFG